jgi:hypothetical protein
MRIEDLEYELDGDMNMEFKTYNDRRVSRGVLGTRI